MKYGFSKGTLQKAVENLGIKYIHIPNLGIESENRKTLETKDDYNALFAIYAKTFDTKIDDMHYLFKLINEYERIAITCFERDVEYCHRGVIAKKMQEGFGIKVRHI